MIADFAPLLACPVPLEDVAPGEPPADVAALWDARVEDSVRLGVRFLMRANRMDALYAEEVAPHQPHGHRPDRAARMGVAALRPGLRRPAGRAAGGAVLGHARPPVAAAKEEGDVYAGELGLAPAGDGDDGEAAGTTSKLFGLTEGAHLPARRQYLRWVQFKGTRDPETGEWDAESDPLLADYAARGYPMRDLRTFPGMTIVGFPTVPLMMRLGLADAAGDRAGGDARAAISLAAPAGALLDRRRAGQPGQLHAEALHRPA